MNRIDKRFDSLKKEKKTAFVPFVTAGDPDYKTSLSVIKLLIDNGADMIELGIPFSDPIADGPTIQAANERALKNGMTVGRVFNIIKEVRNFSDIPICLMVYYNFVYPRCKENALQ